MPSFLTKAALYELRATVFQALLVGVLFYYSTYSRPFHETLRRSFPFGRLLREPFGFPFPGPQEGNPSYWYWNI